MAFELNIFQDTFWAVTNGDIYVSSAGSDAEGDGSPLAPFATIQKALDIVTGQELIVIGSGVYNEELNAGGNGASLIGDGLVILDGENTLTNGLSGFDQAVSEVRNLTIKGFSGTAINSGLKLLTKSVLFNDVAAFGADVRNCVFDTLTVTCSAATRLINCTFIDTVVNSNGNISEVKNCLLNAGSELIIDTTNTLIFDYSNQESGAKVNIDSTEYTSLSAVQTNSSYQVNGVEQAISYNGAAYGDYSLPTNSTLLSLGEFGQPIGAIGKGLSFAQLTNFQFSVSSGIDVNTTASGTEFSLNTNAEEGTIETAILDLGSIKKLSSLSLFGTDFFEITPSAITDDLDLQTVEKRSVRYEMKYGITSAEINNDLYTHFQWNNIPEVDGAGRGNGELSFDRTTARKIVCRYIQLRITLTSNQIFLVQEDFDCLLQEDDCKIIWKTQ